MKSTKILMAFFAMLFFTMAKAQIKNVVSENVKIYGNCKQNIEKAANVKKIAQVDWDKDTQMAAISFDAKKTNKDEILKRIALAGNDSDFYLAPDESYAQLTKDCQYARKSMPKANEELAVNNEKVLIHLNSENMRQMEPMPNQSMTSQNTNQLKPVFDQYFALKDALVNSDANKTSANAKLLQTAINGVDMSKLSMNEHMVWMKVMKDLSFNAEHIEESKSLDHQRDHFIKLSESIYPLMKASKQDSPTYYQHCPMANKGKGANWLSKDKDIKNPFYGSQMLTCGSTIETIK